MARALGVAAIVGLAWGASAAPGQLAHRVRDINTDSWFAHWGGICSGTDRQVATEFAGVVLADESGAGCGLYGYDAASGALVPIAGPVEFGSTAGVVHGRAGPLVFFERSTATTGLELWRTDGTAGGTFLVSEALAGPEGSGWWSWLEAAEPTSYLVRSDASAGAELWATDGTPGGTRLVRDIWPGVNPGVREPFRQIWGELLFFIADDGVAGPEVWRTDGTWAGTFPVSDLFWDSGYDANVQLGALPGAALYYSLLSDGRNALWRSDGTVAGTALIWSAAAPTGWNIYPLSTIDNRVMFAFEADGELQIWSSDGTTAGTQLVAAIAASAGGWFHGFFPAGGRAVFFAADVAHGLEPWVTDGTSVGTHLLLDVRPGPEGSLDTDFGAEVAVLGDLLLMRLDDGVHGRELWRTDGTAAGTALVADLEPGPAGAVIGSLQGAAGGFELFTLLGSNGVMQLWRTDGTAAGTTPLTNLGGPLSPSYPDGLTDAGTLLYFDAQQDASGGWPWRTDGSEAGTIPLEGDLLGYRGWADFVALDDGTVIANSDGDESSLIWSSSWDEIQPLAEVSYYCGHPRHSCGLGHAPPSVGPLALFAKWNADAGSELWATDGTLAGTGLWLDLLPGPDSSRPRNIVDVDDEVWFTALDAAGDEWAWRTRETPGSAEPFAPLLEPLYLDDRVKAIWPFDAPSGRLFFTRYTDEGDELWFSAGDGAWPVALRSGLSWARPIGVAASRMVFTLSEYPDPGIGEELWASDGTPAGTRLVRDIWSGPIGSDLGTGVELGGRVFFRACEPAGGCELWTSDGTTEGTARLLDLEPGPASSFPSGLSKIDGRIYFSACRVATGCEPWVTDGTAAGTRPLPEIVAGPYSSVSGGPWGSWTGSRRFVRSGGLVYFAGDDGTGLELWAMEIEIFYDGFETGDASRWDPPTP